jgi:hypothetical protein
METELSKYNSKSCNYKLYLKYVVKKLECINLVKKYDTTYLERLQWYAYINKRRHEDKVVNEIEAEFGKDLIIVLGDWSNKGRLRFISTPNLGIKRKLAERFEVYNLNEYNTSKIHYKTHVICTNKYVDMKVAKKDSPDQYEIKKVKLHSVLSYKFERQEWGVMKTKSGCINRDLNSILNMEYIVNELIQTGKRPPIFSRPNIQKTRCVVNSDKSSEVKDT